jgi:hypothetical protein
MQIEAGHCAEVVKLEWEGEKNDPEKGQVRPPRPPPRQGRSRRIESRVTSGVDEPSKNVA